ncbi:PTS fructose transporter subunit EIIC [Enterococcus sp. BWB1-3]|uniref:PTS fructose transporter subunit EIIC n=1 Tax=unclassified Enterococcus TaxID=2608891 RepID=UPI001922CF99|nr:MULTISPECIES: PTS fructose transporter subunit EIIC [unclassified Enterococcus]MBL1229805.1 PTS fructose transporter subunit EIIC [Enterococcus sp. BWB1-3]MCB5952445.1 PTS fructose transporter subunit EIIC [Enterococcus sp. BWT-B8]MCB5955397.1 PTS fructose transporter subunit EIIC [Enterococcus sp. CWB-B31]
MNELISLLKDARKHMMTGVSYMIPFVVAGGIMLAVSVLLSGNAAVPSEGVLADIANIGITGLGLMVPMLSGYIAFSMTDRPGLAPGIIGGMIASNIGAGFIGGILSGILAGITVSYLKKIKLSANLRSLMPIFIIPLLGTIIVGGLMYWVIGQPIAAAMEAMTAWLEAMGTGNLVVLGLILGAMIASDMGGPINKVAFGFGSAMVGTLDPVTGVPSDTALLIMAGIGVAICVPPLAMGLATLIAPKKFTVEEKNSGKAALVMGMVGISEGAIPFAAADPFRVIPANIIGGAIGSAAAMTLGAGNPAPWGGWIVLPVVSNPLMYAAATLLGAVVTAVIVVVLKKEIKAEEMETHTGLDKEFDLDITIM